MNVLKIVCRSLRDIQKEGRVDGSREILEFIASNSRVLDSMVIFDESQIDRQDPEMKASSLLHQTQE